MKCQGCGQREAKLIRHVTKSFRHKGKLVVKSDKDHDLCPQCWRAEIDRNRN
jgi:hypothetical protein